LSQLVAYYDENSVELKGQVEIHQSPILSAAGTRSVEGAIRTSLVYVRVPSEAGPFLVPFGDMTIGRSVIDTTSPSGS
jgi:hypothetical protein